MVHVPSIDYDALAAAIAKQPSDHEGLAWAIAQHLPPALTPSFVAGAQALPPQNLNLTELRERQQAQLKVERQTNI